MGKKKAAAKTEVTVVSFANLEGGYARVTFSDGTFKIVKVVPEAVVEAIQAMDESTRNDSADEDEDEDEEEEAPTKKGKASKKAKEEEEDEDDSDEDEDDDEESDDDEEDDDKEDLTAEDLMDSDFDDLEDIVDDYELDIDVDDFDEDEAALRKAIAKEMKIKLPEAKKAKKKK